MPQGTCGGTSIPYPPQLHEPLWQLQGPNGVVHCKYTLGQALTSLLTARQVGKMSDTSTAAVLALMSSILPEDHLCPPTMYKARQVMQVSKFSQRWCACPMGCSSWLATDAGPPAGTTCDCCGGSPFKCSGELACPFWYFPLEGLIRDVLFRDPDFVQAQLQSHFGDRSSWVDWRAWPLYQEMHARLGPQEQARWTHWSTGHYQVGGDGAAIFQFTNHSTFVVMVRLKPAPLGCPAHYASASQAGGAALCLEGTQSLAH